MLLVGTFLICWEDTITVSFSPFQLMMKIHIFLFVIVNGTPQLCICFRSSFTVAPCKGFDTRLSCITAALIKFSISLSVILSSEWSSSYVILEGQVEALSFHGSIH